MTLYLYMQPLDRRDDRLTLARLDALRTLRDALTAMPGWSLSATPHDADLQVEVVNVMPSESLAGVRQDPVQRVLVLRLTRGVDRLDFVCLDGSGGLTAERQAVRRIRDFLGGDDLVLAHGPVECDAPLRAIA